jgi:hypothetical protein
VRAKDATEQTAVIIDSTLEGAYEQLRRAVANDRRDDPDLSEVIQQVQVSGVVQRASYWAEGGLYQFRVVDATGSEWLFQSAASNRAAAEVQAGDVVFVTAYQGNREDWLDVKSISYTAPAGFGGVTFDQANDEEIVDWFELLKREAEERGIFTPVPNGSE